MRSAGNFVKAHRLRRDYHKASLAVRRAKRAVDYAKVDGKLERVPDLEKEVVFRQEDVSAIEVEMSRLAW